MVKFLLYSVDVDQRKVLLTNGGSCRLLLHGISKPEVRRVIYEAALDTGIKTKDQDLLGEYLESIPAPYNVQQEELATRFVEARHNIWLESV